MPISKKDVEHAAHLARLRFSPLELDGIAGQLDRILEHVAKLDELNTEGIEPTASVLTARNVMRADVPAQQPPDPILFEDAPSLQDKLFQVPRILE